MLLSYPKWSESPELNQNDKVVLLSVAYPYFDCSLRDVSMDCWSRQPIAVVSSSSGRGIIAPVVVEGFLYLPLLLSLV